MLRLVATLVALLALVPRAAPATTGAVATEHPLAAEAGAELLRAGGSAVDAALGAAAAVCVVHPTSCGIGGGGFALVRTADGREAALDFREVAPAATSLDRFRSHGRPDPERLRRGGLAVGVPGEVAGWVALQRRFGRLPLGRVLAPAIRLAREGFTLRDAPHLQREIEHSTALLAADPGLRRIFLAGGTEAPGAEFRVVQADLAETLEAVAMRGRDAFYGGPVAAAIAGAVQARDGVLEVADLARYRPVWRRPLSASFHGRRVLTFPPPGSGGVVLEVLGLLARDDLAALGREGATPRHLLAGVLAQAFTDRIRWYGDPDFTTVPLAALLAPPRLAALRARLSAVRIPAPSPALVADAGTAHVSALDGDGNAVALTTTINTAFGAGISVPGTGIVLNNEMDDFALGPDAPNVYGLAGSEANVPAPGKRPQSSMAPTIVLAEGRPELVVGGSGGPFIVSGTVQVLLGVVVFGLDASAAVAAPRIHHQGAPAALVHEEGVTLATRSALARIGHRLVLVRAIGAISAVRRRADDRLEAAGDARKDGGAARAP